MKKFLSTLIVLVLTLNAFAQNNMELRSQLYYSQGMSSLWGYTNPNDNKEYALAGIKDGLAIIDVTDPDNAQELFFLARPMCTWHEMKVWDDHVYCVTECGDGLFIADLSNLPASVDTSYWYGDTSFYFWKAHSIFIDENGFAFLNGFNDHDGNVGNDQRGCMIVDLADPDNPQIAGYYQDNYVHDCYARNDTLWTGEIYVGHFGVVDISDKANPVFLNYQNTPGAFCHNTWLNDAGNVLFTTDEVSGGYVTAFDVSDLSDMKELDRWHANDGSGSVEHNVHVINDYLCVAHYRDGVRIVDAHKPDNLVEVGSYDTHPLSGGGFEGVWGVYPYFPSGTVLAGDRSEGVFVLTPDYKRACYLEGTVIDSITGLGIPNVRVEFLGTTIKDFTTIDGSYKTGIADSGTYDIRFYISYCYTKIITDINLSPALVTTLDEQLICGPNSINDLNEQNSYLTASPNIFSSSTTLNYSLNDFNGDEKFILLNSAGQILKQIDLTTPRGSIVTGENLIRGIYFASIINSKGTVQSLRLVKGD